ncbi:MAG: hypothetical protein HY329_16640 [Chloroflexi bacterium]|nr:hypothetical protein [Chloroflexota bacterium]
MERKRRPSGSDTMRHQATEQESDGIDHKAAWALIGILVAFKLFTAVLIFLASPSGGSFKFLLAMNVAWIAVIALGVGIVVGLPALFLYRKMRVRAKRDKLIYAEWHVE